jgi:hypothetical protein
MSPSKTRIGLAIAVSGWLAFALRALDGPRLVGRVGPAVRLYG